MRCALLTRREGDGPEPKGVLAALGYSAGALSRIIAKHGTPCLIVVISVTGNNTVSTRDEEASGKTFLQDHGSTEHCCDACIAIIDVSEHVQHAFGSSCSWFMVVLLLQERGTALPEYSRVSCRWFHPEHCFWLGNDFCWWAHTHPVRCIVRRDGAFIQS